MSRSFEIYAAAEGSGEFENKVSGGIFGSSLVGSNLQRSEWYIGLIWLLCRLTQAKINISHLYVGDDWYMNGAFH